MVTLQEVIAFWSAKDGSVGHADTMEMIFRLRKHGFTDDVPADVAEFMTEWANADPGDDAGFFAHKAIVALGLEP